MVTSVGMVEGLAVDSVASQHSVSRQPTFMVSAYLLLPTLAHPPPPCLGVRVVWRARNRPNPTPPPTEWSRDPSAPVQARQNHSTPAPPPPPLGL
jgi:hypothetical protein